MVRFRLYVLYGVHTVKGGCNAEILYSKGGVQYGNTRDVAGLYAVTPSSVQDTLAWSWLPIGRKNRHEAGPAAKLRKSRKSRKSKNHPTLIQIEPALNPGVKFDHSLPAIPCAIEYHLVPAPLASPRLASPRLTSTRLVCFGLVLSCSPFVYSVPVFS